MAREMKDTGLQWLGKIPKNWNLVRIGTQYTERRTKVSDTEYPPLSVTMKGILPQLSTAAKTDAHDDRKLVCVGDFAINSRSDRRGSCGISPYDGSVSLINTILTPREKMNPRYYDWLFHSTMFSDEYYSWGHGIVDDLWTTGWQDMKKIMIPEPPLDEQCFIAAFLDRKCAEIDSVIADIQHTIEEYKALKQSIISSAVTRGVRGKRGMQPTGIEWIGDIPVDWSLCRIGSQYFERRTKVSDVDYPPLSVTKKGVVPQLETAAKTDAHDDRKLVRVGDFAINSRSDRRGSCGISGYEGSVSLINTILVPRDAMDPQYYEWLFHSVGFADEFYKWGHGIVDDLWTTGWQDMKKIVIPRPPMDEQREIAEYLESKCTYIDTLIDQKTQLLSELDAYRKSVIYEYVTGKKEVPACQ